MNHTRWRLARERSALEGYTEPPEVVAERREIRLALVLGQLVYDRRTSLGLSQPALGERLGMTADAVESLELGGMLPVTAGFLARLAGALDVTVNLHTAVDGVNAVTLGERVA